MNRLRLTYEQARSLWLHREVLDQLMDDPDRVLSIAQDNLERLKHVHRPDGMAVRCLDQWQSVIDGGLDELVATLTGTDERSSQLRQNSPFAGVLSDDQRMKVLRSFRQHVEREAREIP
ncbi:DNA-binding protein [Brevibacterium antiquum]|uniref:Uncharacterized protein n=1 Tax=Brevibacterium antiquum TaxID=234835 RepID=A0A2H1KP96_9MICO|nr:DNA-binding protein [Brevibacterium antiquum]SMY01580.1 hypothetical protein BANT10_03292 [Brevibacterium antiquum]